MEGSRKARGLAVSYLGGSRPIERGKMYCVCSHTANKGGQIHGEIARGVCVVPSQHNEGERELERRE